MDHQLDNRQAAILVAVIKEYVDTGKPVGSKGIAQKYRLGVSAATVRNVMAKLEKDGYLQQPHVSAGRTPTDKGYKIFVSELMRRFELSERERRKLRAELSHLQEQYMELGRSISRLLSETTKQGAFALFPEASSSSGISNLMDEEADPIQIKEVVKFLENVEEDPDRVLNEYFEEETEVLIGREVKLAKTSDYTIIVSGVKLPSGEKGLIGIVGPKRMKYNRNVSVVEYLSKLLGSGMGVFVIINFQSSIFNQILIV